MEMVCSSYLPDKSVTWTKVSLKDAKMWATPKTVSPSRTWGPKVTTASSFWTFPLRGAMIHKYGDSACKKKTPKMSITHFLFSVNKTSATKPGKNKPPNVRFDLIIKGKNELQIVRFTNSGCALSFVDSNGWQFYKRERNLTFISLWDGEDRKTTRMPDLACQKLLSGEWERHQRVSSEQWTQSKVKMQF